MDWPISWLSVCLVSFPCGCLEALSSVWMPIPGVKALLAWFNIVAVCLFGSEWCLKVEHDDQLFVQTIHQSASHTMVPEKMNDLCRSSIVRSWLLRWWWFQSQECRRPQDFPRFSPVPHPLTDFGSNFWQNCQFLFSQFRQDSASPQHYAKLLNIPSSSS